MPGAVRVGVDSAGGMITGDLAPSVRVNGAPTAVLGASVASHGKDQHAAPVMAQASASVFAQGRARCRAGDQASCGHVATGSGNVVLDEAFARAVSRASDARLRAAVSAYPAPAAVCALDRLPGYMSALYPVGAAVLSEWLARPASTDRATAAPFILPLAWVLGFAEASAAWSDLLANLSNMAAKAELIRMLGTRALLVEGATFDFTLGDIRSLPDTHYQSRSVSTFFGSDLFATLGAFSFRANAAGLVHIVDGQPVVQVTRVVCYLHDSFDFNDEQWLGVLPSLNLECLNLGNDDFRRFRTAVGRGGDFHVVTRPVDVSAAFVFSP